ncbi:MAG: bifunctional ADP-dependent NAD(P)H-hydrate dehydratase/NAD(P)H-hydrate epimerase [Gammaproteobacteria bacterium]|nr:MAG: bifunctional ADP-dependent NAD(P)H-hydrate dehydratase/NAD(P)H-hydrate epimerase [Gammaproteobacteria bacterium]
MSIATNLPSRLYSAAGTRALDRVAIDDLGISGEILMERAGAAAYNALRTQWPRARRLVVVCGMGNNGGDGFVIARLAAEADLPVSVLEVGDAARLQGDAQGAYGRMIAAGISRSVFSPDALAGVDVVVDALFGTGLARPLAGEAGDAVGAINACPAPVMAVDMPSGLSADTGAVMGVAVRANLCVSFIGLKRGLFTAQGPEYCGRVVFNGLGVSPEIYQQVPPTAELLSLEMLRRLLPPRAKDSHKGDFGHVLVVGGEHGYAGAARMAGEAAARVGAGLVSLATRPEHAAEIAAERPELMCHGVESAAQLSALLHKASVVALGPGLGTSTWGKELFTAAIDCDRPLVVDADGLNQLAKRELRRDDWVLTPHPGEAARLLGADTRAVQADRFTAAAAIVDTFDGIAVLKGAGTIVAGGSGFPGVCPYGNPGMSGGGMGDVLTGVIAGLIAQGLDTRQAADLGVCLHGQAGDKAAGAGERGLLATDLMGPLQCLVNPD